MGCKGRHLMAGVVACGLAVPAGASVLESAEGKLLASAPVGMIPLIKRIR